MNNSFQILPVRPVDIDLEDTQYCLAIWEDDLVPGNELLAGIRKFGIFHPPLIQQKSNGFYRIIAGRKRIAAAGILTPDDHVLCNIVPAEMDKPEIFSLILEEAKAGKALDIIQQIQFLNKLVHESSEMAAISFLEPLGYRPQKHILRELLKLRTLSDPVLRSLQREIIPVRNARKLLNLSQNDQASIVQLIEDLRLGGSKQRILIDMCTELIMRREMPLEQILASFPGTMELEQPDNIPQQVATLLSWLHNECYPKSSMAEKKIKSRIANLEPSANMLISHDPSFETDSVTLSLRFPDLTSLEQVIEQIKEIMSDEKNHS